MKKGLLLLLTFSLFSFSHAQVMVEEIDEPSFMDRLYFGGNFGLQFGTNAFFLEASPLAGYMFNNRFSAGAGIIYNFFRVNIDGTKNDAHLYGSRQFARYNFTRNLFSYTELESISVPQSFLTSTGTETNRIWSVSPFIGVGYVLQISPGAAIVVTGLYNLNYKPENSIYNRPFLIRMGFTL